ncbi:unnamed protein product, partial [Effrenium voratum]
AEAALKAKHGRPPTAVELQAALSPQDDEEFAAALARAKFLSQQEQEDDRR